VVFAARRRLAGSAVAGAVRGAADYQQGDSFRILYIHVPSAWMSLFVSR
jgi:ABC-type transport system involved in cytochrome c biogenesis permease subunit